jgi:hypothetical protein
MLLLAVMVSRNSAKSSGENFMVTKTTRQLYDEAILAQHQLLTGALPRVVVDQNGERVEYTAANRGALSSYINLLAGQLGLNTNRVSGPMGVIF